MEKKVIVVCCVMGFLGLLSAATGFAAEATRIKGSQVLIISDTECSYPHSPALPLGLTAAMSLVIAQVIINVSSGCICCRKSPQHSNSNWTIALVCMCISWLTFVMAFVLLLTGAVLNGQHGEQSVYLSNYYCYVVKPGIFTGGSLLSVATILLGIVYYLKLKAVKNSDTDNQWDTSLPNQGAIAMGQPQLPPQTTQDPVFVHEDTYTRRQFT